MNRGGHIQQHPSTQDTRWLPILPNSCLHGVDDGLDISPWSTDQVADLIFASRRVHGLPIDREGRTPTTGKDDLIKWFEERISNSTVALNRADYEEALGMGLYDILVSELDPTDMGGIRQRSLAQHIENALTGYLAEVAVANYFEGKGIERVNLNLGRLGSLDEMVGLDIATIVKNGDERRPNRSIQIKKSKPRSSWPPIPEKGEVPPDLFILCRVGPRYERLLQYFNSLDILDEMTGSLPSEKQREILDRVPDPGPIPVHVTGFVSWSEIESGDLRIERKRKHARVEGGLGKIPLGNTGIRKTAGSGFTGPIGELLGVN